MKKGIMEEPGGYSDQAYQLAKEAHTKSGEMEAL
jgi:hypothetical protein